MAKCTELCNLCQPRHFLTLISDLLRHESDFLDISLPAINVSEQWRPVTDSFVRLRVYEIITP